MKLHRIHIAWIVISLLHSVLFCCTQSDVQPLSSRWESFVTPAEEGAGTLMGVRDRLTGDTLIRPGKYLSAKADTNVIQLTLPDGRIRAYSDRGLPISPIAFDSFIPIGLENSIEVYYLGTNRQEKFYYFPQRHLTIDAKRMVCNNGTYFVVVYNAAAQHFIMDNLDAIIEFDNSMKENQGQPWSPEHDRCLLDLHHKGVSVSEIAITLKRNSGSVRARLKKLGIIE